MWSNVLTAAIGIWLMAAPAVLGYGPPAQTNDHIVGPLIASVSIIACWQVTRALRWVNIVLGVWLLVVPVVLDYSGFDKIAPSMSAGAITAALSLIKGPVDKRFGGGWAGLFKS
jgi:hypothetical protein